jgi:hypothetical protein
MEGQWILFGQAWHVTHGNFFCLLTKYGPLWLSDQAVFMTQTLDKESTPEQFKQSACLVVSPRELQSANDNGVINLCCDALVHDWSEGTPGTPILQLFHGDILFAPTGIDMTGASSFVTGHYGRVDI